MTKTLIRLTFSFIALGFFGAAFLASPVPAQTTDPALTLKRVLLSTGGVGYFEYEALVTDNADLTLDVRRDQVDDVLKSLVVFDHGGGVASVRLAGRDALAERFRDYPFTPEDLTEPARLLASLQGALIRIAGPRQIAGRVLAVVPERQALPDGLGTVERHRLSIKTADGVAQVVLEETESIQFDDPVLDAQVDDALATLAAHRRKERRSLVIASRGTGERQVRVGMVVAAPLWKASYRLTVGDDTRPGRAQGWAVLENMSGQDWDNVSLTVVSGNPVTFRQALYQSYYVARPEVPVEVLGRVLPGADTGAVPASPPAAQPMRIADSRAMQKMMADQPMAEMALSATAVADPAPMSGGAMAVSRDASTAQVRFHVAEPVSVRHGESVMIPIVDQTFEAARIALYQPATHASHPLAAVRMRNDAASALPPGVMTLYELDRRTGAAYVGDAQLAPLPAGDSRLLSFAVDQDIRIDQDHQSERIITGASASRGVFRLKTVASQATTYRFKNSGATDRTLIIEHPRQAGWSLVDPAETDPDMTDTAYRIPVAAPAGESARLDVVLERPITEEMRLTNMALHHFQTYMRDTQLSRQAREAFGALAQMRGEADRLQNALSAGEAERSRIHEDQARLRENLQAVRPDTDLYGRYVRKLDQQESRLETLDRDTEAARQSWRAAEAKLADAIMALTF